MNESRNRVDVPEKDQWDLSPLYPSFAEWDMELAKAKEAVRKIGALSEKKLDEIASLRQVIETLFSTERLLSKLYTYASLKHHEDITENEALSRHQISQSLLFQFKEESAWFEPRLLLLSKEKERAILTSEELKPFRFILEKIFRQREHTLSEKEEMLLSLSLKPLTCAQKAFGALNDADFAFPSPKDSQGKSHTLTHGSYSTLLRSFDRTLRKEAFDNYLSTYQKHENSLSQLLQGAVERDVFFAKARNFPSSLDAALFPHNLPKEIYLQLIKGVREEISALHEYYRLRKEALGIEALHLYDMQVPLTRDLDIKMTFEEAMALVLESAAPLGKEIVAIFEKGLTRERWVDRFENKNKRSGAYSGGCYDSPPYILMNFSGTIRDLFTLAHEAGHSLHSYLSHKHQPFHLSDYSIFVAEVASTFQEELLFRTLLKKAKNRQEKLFYLTTKLDDFRSTFFRQAMFAEFELLLHSHCEQGEPLTCSFLKEKYLELNRFYFGPDVVIDEPIDLEWGRIPHFYYNYYVFQYATGISAASALAEKVLSGKEKERDDYLNFLKSGYSLWPLEALQVGGIDMRSPEPIRLAVQQFRRLTQELANTINEC